MRLLLVLPLLLLASGCNAPDSTRNDAQIAALKAEVEALKSAPKAAAAAAKPPELGQQMLELQIRHARLWEVGQARNWVLMQFQLAEMREAFEGVEETNGDHPTLQPSRLADVMPAMVNPALDQMQAAVDAHDGAKFDAGYDALSAGCTGCHQAADHGFLVIQRPHTPLLDNLRTEPPAGE